VQVDRHTGGTLVMKESSVIAESWHWTIEDVVAGMGSSSSGSWTQGISDLCRRLPSRPIAQPSDAMVSREDEDNSKPTHHFISL